MSDRLFDTNRSKKITYVEAEKYLTDVTVNNSNFPLHRSTREVRRRAANPRNEVSFRAYNDQSYIYLQNTYVIPEIHFIGFADSELQRYDTALALIRFAVDNQINIPELENSGDTILISGIM